MHSYQDKHGRLPPAVVYGSDGQPLLSWRVLILPFIGQEELFEQFKLDEPWDSPHNIQLLPKMPFVFEPPPKVARGMPPHHTILHVFTGKGTAFEGKKGLSLKHDFPDGTSHTLLIIEAGPPVPWTKPENLVYTPDGPLPKLRATFRGQFRVALADGSAIHLSPKISEKTLRAMITRNGEEAFSLADIE
jgi:hypothetical protein